MDIFEIDVAIPATIQRYWGGIQSATVPEVQQFFDDHGDRAECCLAHAVIFNMACNGLANRIDIAVLTN